MAERVRFVSRIHNLNFVVESRKLNRDNEVVREGKEIRFKNGVLETDDPKVIKTLKDSQYCGSAFHEAKDSEEVEAIRQKHSVQMNTGVRTPANTAPKD